MIAAPKAGKRVLTAFGERAVAHSRAMPMHFSHGAGERYWELGRSRARMAGANVSARARGTWPGSKSAAEGALGARE
jgi:hypothetical protein